MPLKLIMAIIFGFFGLLSGIIAACAPIRLLTQFLVIAHVLILVSAVLGVWHYIDRLCAKESK